MKELRVDDIKFKVARLYDSIIIGEKGFSCPYHDVEFRRLDEDTIEAKITLFNEWKDSRYQPHKEIVAVKEFKIDLERRQFALEDKFFDHHYLFGVGGDDDVAIAVLVREEYPSPTGQVRVTARYGYFSACAFSPPDGVAAATEKAIIARYNISIPPSQWRGTLKVDGPESVDVDINALCSHFPKVEIEREFTLPLPFEHVIFNVPDKTLKSRRYRGGNWGGRPIGARIF